MVDLERRLMGGVSLQVEGGAAQHHPFKLTGIELKGSSFHIIHPCLHGMEHCCREVNRRW